MFINNQLYRRLLRRSNRWLFILTLSSFSFFGWYMINELNFNRNYHAMINGDYSKLSRSLLIFCFVISAHERHLTSARAILYTWGKQCDRFYFVTRLQNTSYDLMMLEAFADISNVTSMTINQHTLHVLMNLLYLNTFSTYHWFLRATDDSFVLVPNLRRLILKLHSKEPSNSIAYVGDVEHLYEKHRISTAGSVMLFSRYSLFLLFTTFTIKDNVLQLENDACLTNVIYDHELVHCMRRTGITINSVDNNLILSQNLSTYVMDKRLKGICCSPNTVAFRANNETDIYKFDFFYQRLDATSKIDE